MSSFVAGAMRPVSLLLGIGALALSSAVPAVAQELTATQATILKRITVVASREAKSVLDVPATVTVIDSATLDKRSVRDIQDLVRYEPGVQVDRSASLTQPWATLGGFTVRGVSGNRVQMQVDGSRVLEGIIDGSRDVVDPFNMKQVEIVKGPAGVLWGADALGGVVAFETLDPEDLLDGMDKPWAVEIKTAYDSFDNTFRQQVNAAYEFGDVQVLGSVGRLTANEATLSNAEADGGIWGCPRLPKWTCDKFFPTDISSYNAMGKLVWTPNDDHRVEVLAEIFDRNTEIEQKYDSSSNAVLGTPANNSQYNLTQWTREVNVERMRLALEHEWQVGADFLDSLRWGVSYSPQRRGTDTFKRQDYLIRYTTAHQVRDYGETFLEVEIQAISSFDLGGTHHKLTYGFDGDIVNTYYEDFNENYNSATGTTSETEYNGFSFPDVETVRADLYIQDEITLLDDRLTITPGVRLASYSIDPTKGNAPPYLDGFKPEPIDSLNLIKSISAKYRFDDSWSAYVAYNEGFKMPTSQQLFVSNFDIFNPGAIIIPNPDLKPESVQSYEAGVRGEFDNGWLSATVFHADYADFIRRNEEIEEDVFTTVNLSNVKLSGIELSSEFEVYENLFFNTSVTWQHGRQTEREGASENWYEAATPLTAVLGLRYELPENNLEFEVFGTFAAGPEHRNDPNAFKPDGYAIFDAFAKWEPIENVELTAGVQNIFDTRYFPNTLTGHNMPGTGGLSVSDTPPELRTGPGRTFKLGASIKF